MPTYGFNSGSANTFGFTGSGNVFNTSEGYVQDGFSVAFFSPSGSTAWWQVTGFGFSIPAGENIVGVRGRLWGRSQLAGEGYQFNAQLVVGGSLAGSAKPYQNSPEGAFGQLIYGGAADLWGLSSLTPAQVNAANFGVRITSIASTVATGNNWLDVFQLEITTDTGGTYVMLLGAGSYV